MNRIINTEKKWKKHIIFAREWTEISEHLILNLFRSNRQLMGIKSSKKLLLCDSSWGPSSGKYNTNSII